MAKSSADDEELRRACEAAIEGTKQKVVMSIRVAKSRGIWGKSAKLGRGQMAKPRVLAISSTSTVSLITFPRFDLPPSSSAISEQAGLIVILNFGSK